ncbi:MAG TPA: hypothetical protein VFQ13_16810 [Anaerolineales bacterium]|nr:hypothetical protein [Anaerolineales bacterium]
MHNQPAVNRELLIPILIGGLSVFGIIAVLIIGRVRNAPAEVALTPSSTPFQYIYLGTEPAITTLVVEGSELPPSEEPIMEEPATEAPIILSTVTRRASTPIILTQPNTTRTATSTRTRAPTATSSSSAPANTYDDTDSRLSYSGDWVSLIPVGEAYKDTLHISSTVGNEVRFTFTGPEIQVAYQAGPSLGTITITIDGIGGSPISQAQSTTQNKVWTPSERLSDGTHVIVITHYSGGSINIDSLYVPVLTPTPTKKPTP